MVIEANVKWVNRGGPQLGLSIILHPAFFGVVQIGVYWKSGLQKLITHQISAAIWWYILTSISSLLVVCIHLEFLNLKRSSTSKAWISTRRLFPTRIFLVGQYRLGSLFRCIVLQFVPWRKNLFTCFEIGSELEWESFYWSHNQQVSLPTLFCCL